MAAKFNVASHEDDILCQAQRILETRIALPVETIKPFSLDGKGNRKSIETIKAYLALTMSSFDVEHYHALYFEPSGKLIKGVELAIGDEKSVTPTTREVMRQGLLCNATYVIVAHNHPNGDPRPSDPDRSSTLTMAKVCDIAGIQLLYSFVVAGPRVEDITMITPPARHVRSPLDELMDELGIH